MENNSLKISIISPDSVIFEGDAFAFSSFNDTGPFDVLPRHENFISIIKGKVVIHNHDKTEKEIKIDTGILRVRENSVSVFIGVK